MDVSVLNFISGADPWTDEARLSHSRSQLDWWFYPQPEKRSSAPPGKLPKGGWPHVARGLRTTS